MTSAYAGIVDEARAEVAAGREPSLDALEARLREAAGRDRDGADAEQRARIDEAERSALQGLRRVATVHRARQLVSRPVAGGSAAAAPRPLRAVLRTKPTITGNMDVRRGERDGTTVLEWDAAAAVAAWEVRLSERPDARSEYVVRERFELPGRATEVAVTLGEQPLRLHVLGRARDGRLVRRAIVSSLTRDGWNERWQRRPSAS